MGDSLDAPLLGRLTQKLRPDWARTAAARRVAAGLLVLLAAVIEFRPDPRDGQVTVVIAKHDLSPGSALTADDVVVESRSAPSLPDGALRESSAAVGSVLTAPARRGEVITDVRLLGSRLTAAAAGPDARMVPLHLADAALPDLLRAGDTVDVLAGPENAGVTADQAAAEVIATDAKVVLVSERLASPTSNDERVVLVALPRHSANAVAGAAYHGIFKQRGRAGRFVRSVTASPSGLAWPRLCYAPPPRASSTASRTCPRPQRGSVQTTRPRRRSRRDCGGSFRG